MEPRVRAAVLSFTFASLSAACELHAQGCVRYQVTGLGDLDGGDELSEAFAINNLGQVAGASVWRGEVCCRSTCGSCGWGACGADTHTFLWLPEDVPAWGLQAGMHDLGDLPGGTDNSFALDLNGRGQVVGYSNFAAAGATHAFLWLPEPEYALEAGMHDLGLLCGADGSYSSIGYAINERGEVVGQSGTLPKCAAAVRGISRPFLWQPDAQPLCGVRPQGMLMELGTLQQGCCVPDESGAAYSINEKGQITGESASCEGSSALLWLPEDVPAWGLQAGMHDLGLLPGSQRTAGFGINDRGQVVGISHGSSCQGGLIWLPEPAYGLTAGLHDLRELPGWPDDYCGGAYAINNLGQIVGPGTNDDNARNGAFLWDPANGLRDLNDLIAPSSGWFLRQANDLNDHGQIVGFGCGPSGFTEAFLLTPIQPDLFRRGDCNGDGRFSLDDVSALTQYLVGKEAPCCLDACDADDDGVADLADANFLIKAFHGGALPRPPFPDCGPDPTPDELPACSYPRSICTVSIAAVLRLQQVGPTCLHLLVDNTVPISGGEIAVAYDPGVLSVTAVERGPDFPLGGGEASAELNPAVNCDSPAPLAGFTARWTSSPNGPALLQPGEHRVLKVEIEPAPGAEPGGLSSLAFVECLGNPPARNRVLGEGGTPLEAAPIDGQARVASYQRPGDCNQDSEVDVSDAVCLLLHLFAGVPMELPCGDHAATDPANVSLLDANGDGTVDLSDAVHALSFLFLGGPPHVLGTGCVEIQGCPATCIGCEPPGPVVLPRVHDLAADWSDLQNPNGPWSYNRSPRTAIAKQLPDWDPGACCFVEPQPAWALAEQPSPGHVPVWMKVVSSVVAPGELDLPAGTVAMHGSEDSTAGVTWTSPEDGLVEVSGAV